MATYLERYQSGEYEQVWHELVQNGTRVRIEPLYADAVGVAYETMRRVKQNCQIVVERLRVAGYVFGVYPSGQRAPLAWAGPMRPPWADMPKRIDEIERLEGVGAIPVSLRAFWEVVGGIDFVGFHPSWPNHLDPLVVNRPDGIDQEHAAWRRLVHDGDVEAGPFRIPLAPDIWHKDDYSGGAPYEIVVPNGGIDAILENECRQTTFVNYLRICFRYGGFPGIEDLASEAPQSLADIARDMVPF